jgi:hypothetical protein
MRPFYTTKPVATVAHRHRKADLRAGDPTVPEHGPVERRAGVLDKGKGASGDDSEKPRPPPLFDATPWWVDPADIPPRPFLFGKHFQRKTVSATIAAGGRAKTTLAGIEAVGMAVGRDLLTGDLLPDGPLRVCHINAEEPQDELNRRVAAVCMHYGVTEAHLGGRLIAVSVRANPFRVATLDRGAPVVNEQAIEWLIDFARSNRIDVMSLDPLVSFHRVGESSNADMDVVFKEAFGAVAERADCAVEILHHTGKPKPGQIESTVDDGRGASAIIWAARSARVMNFMTPDDANRFGVDERERRLHISIVNGKINAGASGGASWIKLVPKNLPRGDEVVCASLWTPPDPFVGLTTRDMELARNLAQTGAYRDDVRSPQWFGFALADQLKINIAYGAENDPKDIARVKRIIKIWLKNKVLEIEERSDETRRKRRYIVRGPLEPEVEPRADDDDVVANERSA